MLPAAGLYGHMRANTLKSVALLAGFTVLVAAYWWAGCLAWSALAQLIDFTAPPTASAQDAFEALTAGATRTALALWYVPVLATSIWFAIASLFYAVLVRSATGARPLSRRAAPGLYNRIERLAIAAGLPMPRVEIIETQALNAYAAGLWPDEATIAVTRGLIEKLEPRELDAVLAHEIVHIKHGDVRLMVVALVFAGGITLVGDLVTRLFASRGGGSWSAGDFDGGHWSSEAHRPGSVGAGGFPALFAVLGALLVAAATLAISHVAAILTRLAISRSREFLADAGAVELTKDPDALMSALVKISRRDWVPGACESARALMISQAVDEDDFVASLFSTHPSLEARLAALSAYAGGRLSPKSGPWSRHRTAAAPR